MSIHTKVLRVTDEADRLVRKFAEQDDIGVYDAATLLILSATPVKKRAESSAPTQADFDAMKADRDRLKIQCEEEVKGRRAVEARRDAPDPRVTAYAEETGATYADALDKLVRLGISRAKALDKHAAGKRAA